ncbi:hypothetical protein CIK05_07100 [Bdellovibrio sp. qaytius]|nr:hypothetical protein CIK05_07100 [Bdellovibrio sp. qaytius]
MTKFLPVSEIGQQYVVNAFILWFSLVLINPVGMFVNRHIYGWKHAQTLVLRLKDLNSYLLLISALSVVIISVLYQFTDIFVQYKLWSILAYFAFYIYFSTWFQKLVSIFNLFDYQNDFVILNVMSLVLGLVFSCAGVMYIEPTSLVWLTGLLLGQGLTFIYGYYLLHKYELSKFLENAQPNEQHPEDAKIISKSTFSFCYPIAITTFFMWFLTQGYRIVVERAAGAEMIASIGIGLGLATSLSAIVESVTSQYLYPKYYSSLTNSTLETRSKSWEVLWLKAVALYIPTIFVLFPGSVFAAKIILSKHFEGIYIVAFAGLIIELGRLLSNIIYLAAHAEKKTKTNIVPYFWGAVVLVIYLLGLMYFNKVDIIYCLVGLVFSSTMVLYLNILSIKKLLDMKIQVWPIVMAVLKQAPQLVLFYFCYLYIDTNLYIVTGLCALAGMYYLLSVKNTLKQM